jgi:hypothetical protein
VPENATRRLLIEQGEADTLTFDLTPTMSPRCKATPISRS